MSPARFLKTQLHKLRSWSARRNALRTADRYRVSSTLADWPSSLEHPTEFYLACFQYFHLGFPQELRAHRRYFTTEFRGFGEDAFHVMWSMIFEKLRPANFLEIGVYRGQVLSLAGLMLRRLKVAGTFAGISPFQSIGDSVSQYPKEVDYLTDTRKNLEHFGLPQAELIQAYSTDTQAVSFIESRAWDCIYIDGNHDYQVAKTDWENCARSIKVGGLIVLDDSALDTEYDPPCFATGGHPGPSRVASEIDPSIFKEVLRVGHNRVFERLK